MASVSEEKLFIAAYYGQATQVRALLAAGAESNDSPHLGGPTPLFAAARMITLKWSRFYWRQEADMLDRANRNGETPLFAAACNGGDAVVQTLSAAGADLNKANWNEETPLLKRALNGTLKWSRFYWRHEQI